MVVPGAKFSVRDSSVTETILYGNEKNMLPNSRFNRSDFSGEVANRECCGPGSHAQAALSASSVVDLRDLTVVQSGGELLISGRVQCFYHKQLAQETVRPHAENLRLVNSVSVEG